MVGDNDNPPPKSARARPCPICGKPAVEPWRPFCSKRCSDVDLNRWLSGNYAIPIAQRPQGASNDAPKDDGGKKDEKDG